MLTTDAAKGVDGRYRIEMILHNSDAVVLNPGDSHTFFATLSGWKSSEKTLKIDVGEELEKRKSIVAGWMDNLVLETPEPVINEMFALSKIRACGEYL